MEQASILGLRAPNTRNKWKPEEEQYVIDNYELAGAVAISNVLDRSVNAIYRKAHSLGLKRYQGRRNHHVGWTKQDEATVVGVVNWLAAEVALADCHAHFRVQLPSGRTPMQRGHY